MNSRGKHYQETITNFRKGTMPSTCEQSDDEYEELFLCKPCAEEMKDMVTVEDIRYVKPATKKGACELCNRRRFGYICKVKFKEF